MGESTQKTFNQNMNRIQMVLVVFSILTILSSIFMIMEIMILHAMHLKKDHAIMKAYGEKSPDGRHFMKEDENGRPLANKFKQTLAYSQLFMELATNDKAAAEFVNGIIPTVEK